MMTDLSVCEHEKRGVIMALGELGKRNEPQKRHLKHLGAPWRNVRDPRSDQLLVCSSFRQRRGG